MFGTCVRGHVDERLEVSGLLAVPLGLGETAGGLLDGIGVLRGHGIDLSAMSARRTVL